MIRACADAGTAAGSSGREMKVARRVPTPVWPVIRRTLDARHRVRAIQDLRLPAGTRVEAVQGDRIGGSRVRVHEPSRITCQVEGGAVDAVTCEDDPAERIRSPRNPGTVQ